MPMAINKDYEFVGKMSLANWDFFLGLSNYFLSDLSWEKVSSQSRFPLNEAQSHSHLHWSNLFKHSHQGCPDFVNECVNKAHFTCEHI